MTRAQHLALADAAVTKAEQLADAVEHLAKKTDCTGDAVAALAAAGSLWNDIASTHTALAAALLTEDVRTPEQAHG
ncbi:hypothetical protein ABTY98_21855 [Streptomyces sp. NPDC096040]|uniref:hypothetical protein n=1 Tax=Streptomyces sp. NPDC096040 TaxID=3155541 RepID=UPI003331725A